MSVQDIGANLRRLMQLRGFSISALAERMDVGTATISNILNGKSEPKSSTLLKFAEELGVSFPDLLNDPPKLEKVRFRTRKTLSAREKAERDQILISTALWLHDYRELEDLMENHIHHDLAGLQGQDPRGLALQAREKLGYGNPLEPIRDLPDRIEKAGVKLGVSNFGFKKTYGISVSADHDGPAIIVNSESDISIERQIFTVVHELGHLIMHPDSYDGVEAMNDDVQEKEADLFAGQFLLPDEALREEWNKAAGQHWVDAVLKIKRLFKVSYRTVLYRLSQVNPNFDLNELSVKFSVEYKQKTGHDLKNHYEPDALADPVARADPVAEEDPDSLSHYEFSNDRFLKLVREAYDSGKISISRAGELLSKTAIEMRAQVRSWQDMRIDA